MEIQQYCSVCKAEYGMTVVPTSDEGDDGVVWLQCPSCKGFLPKISSSADFAGGGATSETGDDAAAEPDAPASDEAGTPASEPDAAAEATDPHTPDPDTPEPDSPESGSAEPEPPEPDVPDPLADMDVEAAVPYRPWGDYAEGDVIHHLAWDDYGVVVAKEVLPGNRKVVKVVFAEAGTVRLIEQEGDGP